jgi:hypothetical protein
MAFDDDEFDIIGLLHDIQETERVFFNTIRFLNGDTRSRVMMMYLQNASSTLGVIREYQRTQRNITRMTVTLPALDISGNFFDPVTVRPTQEQITQGTEQNVQVTDTTCSICQEAVTSATRIRQCGHCFHEACISQWFSMNPRCPMCRVDVREAGGAGSHRQRSLDAVMNGVSEHRHIPGDTFDSLLRALNNHTSNEDHRVHPDQQ